MTTLQDTNTSLVFERRILRKIFGPVQCKEGQRIRRNYELRKLTKGENIVIYIKITKTEMVGGILTE